MSARRLLGVGALGLGAMLAAACSPSYDIDMTRPMADGEWTGRSNPDDQGAVGTITITVSGGDITNTVYETAQANGRDKDADYGKNSAGEVFNEEYYARAQAAVDSFEEYSRRLTETDDPNAVDVISGATVAHSQFMQAAIRAISAAQGVDNDAAANRVDIPGLSDSMRDEGLDKDLGGADR